MQARLCALSVACRFWLQRIMSSMRNPRSNTLPVRRTPRAEYINALYLAKIFFLLGGIGSLGLIDRFVYGEFEGKSGSSISRILNLMVIFSSLFIYWSGSRKTRIVRFNRFLPFMAASLPLISLTWSVDPSASLRQGTEYFFAVLGAIGFAEASDGDELMKLVCLVCSASAVASLVQFFVFPDLPGAEFRGMFSQKNVLGQVMVWGVLAGLHSARLKIGHSFRYASAIALCTIVAFMSKSGTSLFAIFVLFWIEMWGRLYLKGGVGRGIATCLAVASIAAAIYFAFDSDLILDALGKDRSLTGRTEIWPYVIEAIGDRPILGWGFWAFWSPLNPRAIEISREVGFGFFITTAHNGVLELLLQMGVVGTVFLSFIWLRNIVLAARCLSGPKGPFAVSTLMLLITIGEIAVSEAVLVSAQEISTALFFTMGLICEQQLRLEREERRSARPLAVRGNQTMLSRSGVGGRHEVGSGVLSRNGSAVPG
jgi:exopolysaccharide production protein ExoQ